MRVNWLHVSTTRRSISRGTLRPARARFSSTWRVPTARLWRCIMSPLRCGAIWLDTICWATFMKTHRKTSSPFRCVYKPPSSSTLKYLFLFAKKLLILFVQPTYSHISNSPVSSQHFLSTLAQLASWRGRSTPPSTASPKISTAQR